MGVITAEPTMPKNGSTLSGGTSHYLAKFSWHECSVEIACVKRNNVALGQHSPSYHEIVKLTALLLFEWAVCLDIKHIYKLQISELAGGMSWYAAAISTTTFKAVSVFLSSPISWFLSNEGVLNYTNLARLSASKWTLLIRHVQPDSLLKKKILKCTTPNVYL